MEKKKTLFFNSFSFVQIWMSETSIEYIFG